MSPTEKVPNQLLALAVAMGLAFGAAACGGDAESAGDMESTPLQDEAPYGEVVDDAPATTPPTAETRPPAQQTTPRPAPGMTPPPVEPSQPAPELPSPVADEPETVEETGMVLPMGTQLTAVLENTLSTRDTETGAVFHARLAEALRGADGTVWIPAGARIEGRVVESRESTSAQEEAALILAITGLVIDGLTYPIEATVTETQMATETRDSAQRQVATVATGAAAGAIVGRILGRDTRSTAVGAAVGAAAGTGIALTTRDGHATMAEGSLITIRLDAPVVVAQR